MSNLFHSPNNNTNKAEGARHWCVIVSMASRYEMKSTKGDSQSSQESFLTMVSFVHALIEKQQKARTRNDVPTLRTTRTKDGGFSKLG